MATYIKKITVATPNKIPQVLTDINNLQGIDTSNESNNDILVYDSASGNFVTRDSATLSNITVSGTITPSGTITGNLIPAADSTYSLGDSNNKWKSLHISGQTIFLGDLQLQDQGGSFAVTTTDGTTVPSANALDSARTISLIDSDYVRARQNPAAVDSALTLALIDSAYIQARQSTTSSLNLGVDYIDSDQALILIDANALDSARALNLIPKFGTDYIDSDQALTLIDANALDSGRATRLVDSAYVQLRQDFAYGSLTGAPTIPSLGNSFIDSAQALILIDANAVDSARITSFVDAAYVQSRQITYTNADFLDSTTVSGVVDAAYVQARQTTYTIPTLYNDFIDSTEALFLIRNNSVDSADVLTLSPKFGTDYIDSTAALTLIDANALDSARALNLIPKLGTDFVDSTQALILIDANALDSGRGQALINSSLTNYFDKSIPNALAYNLTLNDNVRLELGTDSDHILYFDGSGQTRLEGTAGLKLEVGDDLFLTTRDNGHFLFGDPGASVRLYYNGIEKIRTVDSGVVVTGNMKADSATISGITYPKSDGTANHVIATDGAGNLSFRSVNVLAGGLDSELSRNLILDEVDSDYISARVSSTGVNISNQGTPLSNVGITLDFVGTGITASGTGSTKTITVAAGLESAAINSLITKRGPGGDSLQTYLDSYYVEALIDSSYIQLRQDLSYSSLTGAPTIPALGTEFVDSAQALILIDANALDSGRATRLIDSAYVQARVTAGTDSDATIALINDHALDSGRGTSLITATVDAAYVQARQTTYTIPTLGGDFVDSAQTLILIDANALDSGRATSLIDSAYVQARVTAGTDSDATIALINEHALDSARALDLIPKLGTDFIDSAQALILIDANALDSGRVTSLIDAAYVQARQSGGEITIQEEGSPLSTAATTLNFVGSNVTATGTGTTKTITITGGGDGLLDSARATDFIDSAYVQARQTRGPGGAILSVHLDSNYTTALIDSSYIQARQSATEGTDPIFKTIAVSGQNSVVADTTTDTLTLAVDSNLTITTNDTTDTITFSTIRTIVDSEGIKDIVDSDYVKLKGNGFVRSNEHDTLTSRLTITGGSIRTSDGISNFVGLGDNDETKLYHNNGNGYILQNSGSLVIGAATIFLTDQSLNNTAQITATGSTDLYHNKVKKFETTANGVNVVGNVYQDNIAVDSDWVKSIIDSDQVQLKGHVRQSSITLATAGADQVVDQYSATVSRTSKYMVEMKDSDGADYHALELLVTHDGTNVYMTEYGIIKITGTEDSDLGTIDGDINSGNVRLKVTTTRDNIKVSTSRTSMGA